MGYSILILIILGVIGLSLNSSIEKENKECGYKYRDFDGEYLGGYPDLEGGKKAEILVTQKGLVITMKNSTKFIANGDLIKAEIMSQQQIEKNVSIGKILAFGILAWGLKNTHNVVNNFLVVTCKDNEQEKSIILKTRDMEQLTRILKM